MKKLFALAGAVLLPLSLLSVPVAAHAQGLANPAGPITTSGSTILDNGVAWTPYGFTLSNFQNENQTYVPGALSTIEAELDSVATTWHGNVVRIQIQQDEWLSPTPHTGYASTYYQTLVTSAIDYAESLGLVVVLNDQTEANPETNISATSPGLNVSNAANEDDPTAATESFWASVATTTNASGTEFSADPDIILDLFNEPRLAVGGNPDWTVWQNGGTISGVTYIGEQQLVDYIRTLGYTSQVWVENTSNNAFEYVIQHPAAEITDPDNDLVYSYHHVDTGDITPSQASWESDFGDLVTDDHLPVVDGEWTNRTYFPSEWPGAAGNGNAGQCWADAPSEVPLYLDYLSNIGVGMTLWTLGPDPDDPSHDVMNTLSGYGDYNSYSGWTSGCEEASNTGVRHGAGQDVQDWFAANDAFNP